MTDEVKLSGPACRAARGLLGWSQADLVREAGVSYSTVVNIEGDAPVKAETEAKVISTFAKHSVEILNGDAPGARLRSGRSL